MYGIYVVLAGAALIGYEIYTSIKERGVKHGQDNKDGGDRTVGNHTNGEHRPDSKHNRAGGVIAKKGGTEDDEVFEQNKLDTVSDSVRDNIHGQPDGNALRNNQVEGVKEDIDELSTNSNDGGGNDGRNVHSQSDGGGDTDGTEVPENGGSSTSDNENLKGD